MEELTNPGNISDPSRNVLALVGNAVDYLKDQHMQGQKFYDDKLALIVESLKREMELMSESLKREMVLAVESSRREREAESARVNFNRSVDTEAVKVANQISIKQAEVLASQMAENAETLRASMAKTAEALALQLLQVTTSLDTRLKVVEEKQYVVAGSSKGRGEMWGWLFGGFMSIITIVGLILKFI